MPYHGIRGQGIATIEANGHQVLEKLAQRYLQDTRPQFKQWLLSREGSLRIESEPLLKLLYSDLDPSAERLQISYLKEQLANEAQDMLEAMQEVTKRGFYFSGNELQNAHLVTLMTDLLVARSKWISQMDVVNKRAEGEEAEHFARATYQAQAGKLKKLLNKLEPE